MKLPKAEPATPEEVVDMLAAQITGDPRAPTVLALDPQMLVEHFEQRAALEADAENLEAYHAELLPPGYVVIFTIDAKRRTIYSLRPPAGTELVRRVCAVDKRVVLAEAWDHYHTRWPDGVTPDLLDQLVQQPPAPSCYVRRTLWEMALHHVAFTSSIHAENLIAKDPSRSAAEREAALSLAIDVQITSGPLEAMRMARLAYLMGAWPDEDSERAAGTFCDDPQTVLPWIAVFSRYMNRAHPNAGRWWAEICLNSTTQPPSTKEAERRMSLAVMRAWAATLLMAQACAVELIAGPSRRLAEQCTLEAWHARQRIASLRLVPRGETNARDLVRWAKWVLRKGAPRLLAILDRQFVGFGMKGGPLDQA